MRGSIILAIVVILLICILSPAKSSRPVNVVIIAPGEMKVIRDDNQTHLLIAADLLNGKVIKNTITEQELQAILDSKTMQAEE